MRILHVVESLERGGLERVVISLARAQRDGGHEVAVNCLFREGLLADELRAAGVPVASAGKVAGVDLRAIARLRGHIRAFGADIVHSHNAVANYYAAAAVLGSRTRLVNTRHGMGAGAAARKEQLYRLSLRRTGAVAAVCEAARVSFADTGIAPADKLQVVRNGIELPAFDPAGSAREGARAALDLDPRAFVVGTVGRLNPAKNHARLVEAFAQLFARRPDSRLVIIGGGELRESIHRQVVEAGLADVVSMTGDRSDVKSLLPALDVFALTSDTEGYSVALLEAGAAALPCVVSDTGGNTEIVQDGVTGIVVRQNQSVAFAVAFEALATDAALRHRLGRAARVWVEENGSATAMVRAYDRFYGTAVADISRRASAA